MVKVSPSPYMQFGASTTSRVIPTAANNTADYCSILADPFDEYLNARIPDRCNLPTRVVALYTEGVISANVNGCAGIQLNVDKWGATASWASESGASTDAVIAFNATTTLPGAGTLAAAATRIVAAGVKIECLASDGYNGGTIYATQKCRFETPATAFTSSTAMTAARMNGFGPAKHGAFSTYRPADESDNDYATASSVVGGLQVHVNLGAYPATTVIPAAQFKYKIVLHYEILPNSDSENGPGVLAYGPQEDAADEVVDRIARQIPAVGGGSERASISQQFDNFRRMSQQMLRSARLPMALPMAPPRLPMAIPIAPPGGSNPRGRANRAARSLPSARFFTPPNRPKLSRPRANSLGAYAAGTNKRRRM
jgi:hypothetical protein